LEKNNLQKRSNMHDLVELFCSIDDFWKTFKSKWDAHLIDRKKK